MKKSLLALAVLGAFAGAASAQSSVTVYGLADAGVVFESGNVAGSVTKVTSGIGAGSRIGFRGTEDLGGGLSANFVMETGMNLDTGGSAQSATNANPQGVIFARQAFVGLKGGFGAVTLGRQYTPYFNVVSGIADPFATGFAGNSTNIMSSTGIRASNSILYTSPNFGGFSADLMYSAGETVGDNTVSRGLGGSAGYANGPINVRLGYFQRNPSAARTAAGDDKAKNTILAGTYDFGAAKVHAAYAKNDGPNSAPYGASGNPIGGTTATAAAYNPFGAAVAPVAAGGTVSGSTDSRDWLLGVTVPFGASKVLASYIRHDDKNTANQDADQWAVGYIYSLSKRTDLYTSYARIKNKNGAAFVVGNAGELQPSGDKAFNVGVQHRF